MLRLSEHAAYGRIEAARVARKFPIVLDLLAEGAVTLTTVTLLGPVLTPGNHQQVLDEARHLSKREVEHLVARLRPQPSIAESVRKLPSAKVAHVIDLLADATSDGAATATPVPSSQPVPPRQVALTPLAPDRYEVQLTVTRATHDKLRRAQDLLRHSIPAGDLAEIVDRAVTPLSPISSGPNSRQSSVQAPVRSRSRVATHPVGRQASGVETRRRPLRGLSAPRVAAENAGAFWSLITSSRTRSAVHDCREPRTALPRAQSPRGRALLQRSIAAPSGSPTGVR